MRSAKKPIRPIKPAAKKAMDDLRVKNAVGQNQKKIGTYFEQMQEMEKATMTKQLAATQKKPGFWQRRRDKKRAKQDLEIEKAKKIAERAKLAQAAKKAVKPSKEVLKARAAKEVERKQVIAMAKKVASSKTFTEACKQAGYNDPAKVFIQGYVQLQKDLKRDIEMEMFNAKMEADIAHKKFSHTRFYAKEVLKLLKKKIAKKGQQ